MSGIIHYMRSLAQHISQSGELNVFCLRKFSKQPIVFIGEDPRNLPSADNCPMIVLMSGGRSMDAADASCGIITRAVKIGVALHDADTDPSAMTGFPSIFELSGAETLEDFMDILQRVVERFQDPDGRCSAVPFNGPDDVIEPPFYKSWIGQTVTFESEIFEGE